MPKQTEQPPPIRFKESVIVPGEPFGQFIAANSPSPYHDISEVPPPLRALIVTGEPEADEPLEGRANFELNVTYLMTSDGRRGRALGRQAAELEARARQQEQAEEILEQPLPPELEEALEEAHAEHVNRQLAEAEVNGRWIDRADEVARGELLPEEEVNEL